MISVFEMKVSIVDKLKDKEIEFRKEHIPIVGREKGEFLLKLVQKYKPKHILEFGMASGYSGTILASEGAKLTTIEVSTPMIPLATELFEWFGVDATILIGDAKENFDVVRETGQKFDFVFIDHAIKNYLEAFAFAKEVATSGAVILFDNINSSKCASVKSKLLAENTCEIFNVGDGMMIIRS